MTAWPLPPYIVLWVAQLATPLHARHAWRLLPLLRGLLFAKGRRTVAAWLRAAGVGWLVVHPAVSAPPLSPGADSWLKAMLLLLFAYGGYEAALNPMGEAHNPRRDVAFALFAALGVGLAAFQLQVRHDAHQRIVDLVCRAQRQLRQRRVLFIVGELRFELHLLLG